jgi:hypothetical protein
MAHVRTANKEGTAKQLAEASEGYQADGVGFYTHHEARPRISRDRRAAPPMTTRELIAYHERKLRTLQAEHRAGFTDEVRRLKNHRDQDAKQNFLAALWKQLAKELRK